MNKEKYYIFPLVLLTEPGVEFSHWIRKIRTVLEDMERATKSANMLDAKIESIDIINNDGIPRFNMKTVKNE